MSAKLTRLPIRLADKNHGGIRAHHREFLLAFACAPFAVQSGTAAAPDKIVSKVAVLWLSIRLDRARGELRGQGQ